MGQAVPLALLAISGRGWSPLSNGQITLQESEEATGSDGSATVEVA